MEVKVVLGSLVALECDALPSNPPPQMQWNYGIGMVPNDSVSKVFFLNGGKFLYITELNEVRLRHRYFCFVTNVTRDRIYSNTFYLLKDNLLPGIIEEYKQIGNLNGIPGEWLSFVYAAGYKKISSMGVNGVTIQCQDQRIDFVHTDVGIVYFKVPKYVGNSTELTITCLRLTADGSKTPTTANLTILGKYITPRLSIYSMLSTIWCHLYQIKQGSPFLYQVPLS